MALVSSLLSAIVRADGDALVMHVGEKPYVVTQSGNVELSSQGLNLEAMSGMLTQLLPPDAMRSLAEFGAVEHELLPRQAMQGDRFTVVAARGGEDIWIEIRRHRVPRAIEILPVASEPRIDEVLAPVFARAEELASLGGAPVPVPSVPSVEAAAPVIATVPPADPVPSTREVPTAVSTSEAMLSGGLPIEEQLKQGLATETTVAKKSMDEARPSVPASPRVHVPPRVDVPASVDLEPSVNVAPPANVQPRADVQPSANVQPHADAQPSVDVQASVDVQPTVREVSPVSARADLDTSVGETSPPSARADADGRAGESVAASARMGVDSRVSEASPVSARAAVDASVADTSPASARMEVPTTVVETPPVAAHVEVEAKGGEASPAFARIDMGASEGATPPVAARVEPVAARVELDTSDDETPPAQTRREVEASPGGPVLVPMTRAVRVDQTIRSSPARPGGVERLLALAASRGASVLCLTSQSRPFLRADGEIHVLEGEAPLAAADVEGAVLELTPEGSREALRRGEPTEWVSEFEGIGRIRCTTFRDYRGPGAFFHLISARPISAEQLGLARGIQGLATESDGLVVVAAPRGGGKSTLVAAFVDLINRQQAGYVVTLEKQIRIVHENRHSLISQREVRGTAAEVVSAARAALRENPDVMVLEDAGSAEVIQLALDAAGSGLLVFVSVTAPSTIGAIVRMLDWFPPERRPSVQAALAERLRGAVSQVMLRKAGGGRVAARELLLTTTAVASVLHEGQVGQLSVAMDSGRKHGMVPLNDALLALVQTGVVDVREAYRKADNQDALLKLLKREGVDTSFVERLA